MAKRIARVYLARMAGAFKDILPLRRDIVYKNGRQSHPEIRAVAGVAKSEELRLSWDNRPIPAAPEGGRVLRSLVNYLMRKTRIWKKFAGVIANRGWAI